MCDFLKALFGIASGAAIGSGRTEGANRTRVGAELEARSRAYNSRFFGQEAARQQALYEEAMGGGRKEEAWSTLSTVTLNVMGMPGWQRENPFWVHEKIIRTNERDREAEKIRLTPPEASIRVDGEKRAVHPGAYRPIEGYKPIEHEKHEDFAVRLAERDRPKQE